MLYQLSYTCELAFFDTIRNHFSIPLAQNLYPRCATAEPSRGYTGAMRRDFIGIIVVAVIAIAIGVYMFYSGQDVSSTFPNNQQSAVIVSFEALAEGSRSKVESRVNYLIETQEELVELWKFLEEPPPVPKVDFTKKVVAAVFAGKAPTSGYDINVVEVQDADKRVVKIELIKPDESCILAQSLTAPYQVIELPKTSLPFTHADVWTTKSCS